MSVNKKLFELASKDDKVKAELNEATFKVLFDLLKEKGFAEDAAEAVDTAMTKVAEAHGIKAVAGGAKIMKCYRSGEGKGYGWECNCGFVGAGGGLAACGCCYTDEGIGNND